MAGPARLFPFCNEVDITLYNRKSNNGKYLSLVVNFILFIKQGTNQICIDECII